GCRRDSATGLDAVRCVLARVTLPETTCGPMPRPVQHRLDRAAQLLDRAAHAGSVRPARAAVRRAVEILAQGLRIIPRFERNGAISGDCGRALRTVLVD